MIYNNWKYDWRMDVWEKTTIEVLLRDVMPALSIEVGTDRGGCLELIAKLSNKAVSIDIDNTVEKRIGESFDNVDFRTGDSSVILASTLDELETRGESPGFILIDADHSESGIFKDLSSLKHLVPYSRCYVVGHDSWNPDCRAGMLAFEWQQLEFCHSIDIDFVPGCFRGPEHPQAGAMWGGLMVAEFLPHKRIDRLEVKRKCQAMWDSVYSNSCYLGKVID